MLKIDLSIKRPGFGLDARFDWPGGVLGVVGGSGAGKTTLLNLIAGLLRPSTGRIVIDQQVAFDRRAGVDLPPEKRGLGLAFQDDRLWPHLSVRKNLAYGLKRTKLRQPRWTIEQVAEWLNITHLLSRVPQGLSGGEARRVGVARAVLGHPRLLLLDEPLTGLDAKSARETMAVIRRVIRETGVPAVIVSHRHEALDGLCTHVLVIADGRVHLADAAALWPEANRWPVQVLEHRPREGVTWLAIEGAASDNRRGALIATAFRPTLSIGQPVTAVLSSHQVVLAMAPAETVSMQNKVCGVIRRVQPIQDLVPAGSGLLDVSPPQAGRVVHCVVEWMPGVRCAAVVTPQAVNAFALRPGSRVWCLFKATAVWIEAAP